MFWQFDTGFISQIDTLLDKEGVTIEELMEEDDILQECKSQNQKLIQFITRPAVLEAMITMITSEPPLNANERVRFKYANIACEIITSDVNVISDALVCDETLLNKLYNFIDTDKQLNPLLSSFYSKVMGLIFVKRTEIVFEFFKNKDLISLLLNHIETSAIMDLILKFIISIDNLELRSTIIKWLHDNCLISKLIAVFKSNKSDQSYINAALLICDIIKSSREHQSLLQDKVDGDLLLDSLESTETVNELLENIFTCRTESCLVSGISILQSLLEYKRHCLTINVEHMAKPQTNIQQTNEFDGMPQCYSQQITRTEMIGSEQISLLDADRLAKCVKQVHVTIISRLSDFASLLLNPPHRNPIRTTVGLINKPLGATRLEVAHLITALLSSNNIELMDKLAELNILPILINLFFEYRWNNFLHKHVEQTINCILINCKSNLNNLSASQQNSDEQLTNKSNLIVQLLTQCQLIERILESFDSNSIEDNNKNSKNYRPGYIGHLVNISNFIVDKCDQQLLQQLLNEELFEKWNIFVKQTLSEINKQMCTPLVSEMSASVNLDDEAIRQQDSALQQAFIEYQMQQMTRNLCTQIAFAPNEFAEVNDNIPIQIDQLSKINFNFDNQLHEKDKSIEFEKICTERVKSSLESNSSDEEDLWEDRDLTFSQTSNIQHKKMFNEESSSFSEDRFNFNASNNENRAISMDVDQNDPWTSDSTTSHVTPIPMDTSNPWNMRNKCENTSSSIEADSWADFSSFSTSEFNSSIITTNANNVITTSCTALSSSGSHGDNQSGCPESTTCDESLISQVGSSVSIIETNYTGLMNDFQKVISEQEQENIVTSTNDFLQNGPS